MNQNHRNTNLNELGKILKPEKTNTNKITNNRNQVLEKELTGQNKYVTNLNNKINPQTSNLKLLPCLVGLNNLNNEIDNCKKHKMEEYKNDVPDELELSPTTSYKRVNPPPKSPRFRNKPIFPESESIFCHTPENLETVQLDEHITMLPSANGLNTDRRNLSPPQRIDNDSFSSINGKNFLSPNRRDNTYHLSVNNKQNTNLHMIDTVISVDLPSSISANNSMYQNKNPCPPLLQKIHMKYNLTTLGLSAFPSKPIHANKSLNDLVPNHYQNPKSVKNLVLSGKNHKESNVFTQLDISMRSEYSDRSIKKENPTTHRLINSHQINDYLQITKKTEATPVLTKNLTTQSCSQSRSNEKSPENRKFSCNSFLRMLGIEKSRKFKCECNTGISDEETCNRAISWISIKYRPDEFPYLKHTYERLLNTHEIKLQESFIQIEKDIHRTHPKWEYIEPGSEGSKVLERILKTFSKYDPSLGYAQGMNFIASSLLFHAEEFIAFWLLVMVFEKFEMRDIYLPRLPGLSKHCQIIDVLILNYIPDLYSHFCKHHLKVELFGAEWILTLFGSIIPIDKMGNFYDHLLKEGWPFFYKLVNILLNNCKNDLLRETDVAGILTILKKYVEDKKKVDITSSFTQYKRLSWAKLFTVAANNKTIDTRFIHKMHLNFDSEKQVFKINALDTEI